MNMDKEARNDYIVSSRQEGCEVSELAVVTELSARAVYKILQKRGITAKSEKNLQKSVKST